MRVQEINNNSINLLLKKNMTSKGKLSEAEQKALMKFAEVSKEYANKGATKEMLNVARAIFMRGYTEGYKELAEDINKLLNN